MPQPRKSSSSGSSGGSSRSSRKSSSSSGSRSRSTSSASRSGSARSSSSKSGASRSGTSRSAAGRKGGQRSAASRQGASARRSASAGASQAQTAAQSEANAVEQGINALRNAMTARATDSLNLVMLTRDRMQEALDDAVERGHMTQQTANQLAQDLIKRTRQEAKDIFSDMEQLLGRGRSGLEGAAKKVKGSGATDRALREADRARRVVGVGPSFPIIGYDDLTAAQISGRLDTLSPAELRKVRDYERRHGNRKSVLTAIERKLA
jgi:polyhydroxyalkanoate synthesis regulator phasin